MFWDVLKTICLFFKNCLCICMTVMKILWQELMHRVSFLIAFWHYLMFIKFWCKSLERLESCITYPWSFGIVRFLLLLCEIKQHFMYKILTIRNSVAEICVDNSLVGSAMLFYFSLLSVRIYFYFMNRFWSNWINEMHLI